MKPHRGSNDFSPLADLHERALEETDAEVSSGAERFMAWFESHVEGSAERLADGEGERRVAAVEPQIPEVAGGGARMTQVIWLPLVLAAAAAAALWFVLRPTNPTALPPFAPAVRLWAPAPAAGQEGACRSVIRASGASPLIDDFEDGNELVALLEGRNGYWIALADTDADGVEPVLLPSLRPDATPANGRALHLSGGRLQRWGASVQVEFGSSCYDASVYSGLAFEARGPGRVYVGVRGEGAVPVERGGSCTEDCYRSHLAGITLEEGWHTYVIPWRDLHQEGSAVPVDPARLWALEFLIRAEDTPYDFWIDDVAFANRPNGRGGR